MLEGMNDLILQEINSERAPTRVSIDPEDILGVTPDGFLLVHEGDRVVLQDPSMVSVDSGKRVPAFADHEILDFRFRRSDDGALHYRLAIIHHKDLGMASAATLISGNRVAVANESGVLHVIDIGDIQGPELCDVAVGQ